MGDNVMGSFRTNRPPRGRRLGRGRGFRTFRLVRRWFRHESGGIERIAWPLTGSVCSFIVRSIPEGLMFREFSSIWEIQAKGRWRLSLDSGTSRNPTSTTAATGRCIQKTACQSMASTRAPPTIGPAINPTEPAATQIPIAFERSSRGKTSVMIERVAGNIKAAARPWTARKAMSVSAFGAREAKPAAPPKMTVPIPNQRLRPKRSPTVPPTNRSPASIKM